MAWNEGVLRALRDGSIIQEGTRTGRLYNASRRVTAVAASYKYLSGRVAHNPQL